MTRLSDLVGMLAVSNNKEIKALANKLVNEVGDAKTHKIEVDIETDGSFLIYGQKVYKETVLGSSKEECLRLLSHSLRSIECETFTDDGYTLGETFKLFLIEMALEDLKNSDFSKINSDTKISLIYKGPKHVIDVCGVIFTI